MIAYNIEFISYDGKYPNLCSGTLIIKVNDIEYKFEYLLITGGTVSFDKYWNEDVTQGPWTLNIKNKQLLELVEIHGDSIIGDLLNVINRFIPYGCCGGCV